MPRKADFLNVREHLLHAKLIKEGFDQYGWCPTIEHEFRKFMLINAGILRKHEAKRVNGDRKDIRVNV